MSSDPISRWIDAWRRLGGPQSINIDSLTSLHQHLLVELPRVLARLAGCTTERERAAVLAELNHVLEAATRQIGSVTAVGLRRGAVWAAWEAQRTRVAALTAQHFVASIRAIPPGSWRAALDRWIDCAERAFQEVAHTPAYAKAQAALWTAAMEALPERSHPQQNAAARAPGHPSHPSQPDPTASARGHRETARIRAVKIGSGRRGSRRASSRGRR